MTSLPGASVAAAVRLVRRCWRSTDPAARRRELIGRTPASLTILSSGRARTLVERRRRTANATKKGPRR